MKIDVGPRTYKVSVRENMEDLGQTWADLGIIYISDEQPTDAARDTLLHEVLHAIWDVTGLHYEMKGTEQEEELIRRISPVLLDVLRRNPRLVRTLLEK